MKPVHKGGNPLRNLGLLVLIASSLAFFMSGFIYGIQGSELWFSRMAIASILLGLFLIADKN